MNGTRYRAWQFVHPDLDVQGHSPGLQITSRGRVKMVEGTAAIRQGLMLLLSTAPGERVMRPDYGCDLHRLVFSPNDDTTAGLAIHYVRRALERWEPRIDILHLDATPDSQRPELLEISLAYRIRATAQVDELSLSLSLLGEEG